MKAPPLLIPVMTAVLAVSLVVVTLLPPILLFAKDGQRSWVDRMQEWMLLDSMNIDRLAERVPYDSIRISRGACFGDCRPDSLTMCRNGHAFLESERGSFEVMGGGETYIRYAQLFAIALEADAKPRPPRAQFITDDQSIQIVATTGTQEQVIRIGGFRPPPEVWALSVVLENRVDRAHEELRADGAGKLKSRSSCQ